MAFALDMLSFGRMALSRHEGGGFLEEEFTTYPWQGHPGDTLFSDESKTTSNHHLVESWPNLTTHHIFCSSRLFCRAPRISIWEYNNRMTLRSEMELSFSKKFGWEELFFCQRVTWTYHPFPNGTFFLSYAGAYTWCVRKRVVPP